jgi:riboflavin synthase alpha subunit
MFTGIIQDVGEVLEAGQQLVVRGRLPYPVPVGGSVSVQGCCLTTVSAERLEFNLSQETLRRSTLGSLRIGDSVNLEAALRIGDPLGGHFVMGHVDCVGRLVGIEGEEFLFEATPDAAPFLVDKGSIAVDGVSLTVVAPAGSRFGVAVIPHTLTATTLGRLKPGEEVNLEYDVLARYARRCV